MNSGKQIDYFFLYDNVAQEWQQVSLDTLAKFNDNELLIVPVYANGEQGKQTTWGEFMRAKTQEQKKEKGFWQSVGCFLAADLTAPIKQQIEREKKAEEAKKEAKRPVLERDMPTGSYYYEIVTHDKYVKSRFDATGFKNKINQLSKRGFRLVSFGTVSGLPSEDELMEKIVWEGHLGKDSSTSIQDYKIAVAIMEKQIIRAESPSTPPLAEE